MFCNKCGAPNPDNSAFCNKCGYAFPKVEEAVQVTAVQPEPQVAAPQPQVAVQPQPIPQPVPSPEQKKNNKGLIIGIIAGVLVLAGIITGVVIWVMNNSGGSSAGGNSGNDEKKEEKKEKEQDEKKNDGETQNSGFEFNGTWYVTAWVYNYGDADEKIEYSDEVINEIEFMGDGTAVIDGEECEYTYEDDVITLVFGGSDTEMYRIIEKGGEVYFISENNNGFLLSREAVAGSGNGDAYNTNRVERSYDESSSTPSSGYGNGATDVACAFLDSYYTGDFSTASYYASGYMAEQVEAAMGASQEDVQAFLDHFSGMYYEIGEVSVGSTTATVGIMMYIDGDGDDAAVELEYINGEWKVVNVDQ